MLATLLCAALQPSVTPVDRLGESWWRNRHEAKLQLVKSQKFDCMLLGDSITHGWENGNGVERVFSAYFGERSVLNLGYSGDRTEHVLWRLQNGEVEGQSPKLIMLMIGTNNLGAGQSVSQTIAGVRAVVQELESRFPLAKILLLDVFPRVNAAGALNTSVSMVNDDLQSLGSKRVIYRPIGSVFIQNQTIPKSIMPDGLHPNGHGYWLWAKAVEPVLDSVLGKRPNTATRPQPGIERDFYNWMDRHNAALFLRKPVDGVLIGDSITHFWGGKPWSAVRLGNASFQAAFSHQSVLNLGFGWDRTQQVLWRLQHGELQGLHPKWVSILIGTNNLSPGMVRANTDEEIIAGIKAVVSQVRLQAPDAKITLVGILPRGKEADFVDRYRIIRINRELANVKGVRFVDFGAKLLNSDGTFNANFSKDFLHLNDAGYEFYREALFAPN